MLVTVTVMFIFLCRENARVLNATYTPPSRDGMANHLIPAWYKVENANLISELNDAGKVAGQA